MRYKLQEKGIFVFSDPAGANSVLASIDDITKCGDKNNVDFMVFTNSVGVFPNEYTNLVKIRDFSIKVYSEILSKFKPDYIFTATSNNNYEHNVRLLSQQKGIRTIAFIDHWTNYLERFRFNNKTLFPDEIWVINDIAKKEAIEAGLPEDKIFISGNPYYKKIKKFVPKIDKESFLKEYAIPLDKKIIMFISDDLRESFPKDAKDKCILGFDEFTVLSDILNSFYEIDNKGLIDFSKYLFLIKIHPRGEISKFDSLIKNRKYKFLNIEVRKKINPLTITYYTDYVLGMFSNMVIEALLMEKKVLRVQTGQIGEDILKFDEVRCEIVTKKNKIEEALINLYKHKKRKR